MIKITTKATAAIIITVIGIESSSSSFVTGIAAFAFLSDPSLFN